MAISSWLVRASFSAASPIVRAATMLLSDTETARSRREATLPVSRSQGYLHWIGRSPPSSGKLRQRPAHEGNLRQMPASEGGGRQDTARHGVLRRRSIGRVQYGRACEPGGAKIVDLGMLMPCYRPGQRHNSITNVPAAVGERDALSRRSAAPTGSRATLRTSSPRSPRPATSRPPIGPRILRASNNSNQLTKLSIQTVRVDLHGGASARGSGISRGTPRGGARRSSAHRRMAVR